MATTELRDFDGQPVSAIYFASQRLLLDARDRLRKTGPILLEADIKPTDRFLMERFVTGSLRIHGAAIPRAGFSEYLDPGIAPVEYRPRLKALSIDIETDYKAQALYSIALYSPAISIVFMRGEKTDTSPRVDSAVAERALTLDFYPDEKSLLRAMIEHIQRLDPDLMMGWNVVNFDLRCLQKFADRVRVPLALGRAGEEVRWRQSREGGERFYATISGRLVLDGIELMRSATYQFENFSLEYVAQKLLGRGKLIDDVDQRGAEISELFETDKEALAAYNLEDCRLVWDIFAQEKLLQFAIERSLLTGLEPDRYGGSVAAFDFLYLPRLHRKGYVAPALEQLEAESMSPGGYVLDSVPGIHDNVIVLDFKSLYPSIIRTFQVDPLALVESVREPNPIPGFDGGSFSRQRAILPGLIERLWKARDRARESGDKVLSNAIKIIMN